jgi:hypothetical protein
MRSSPQLRARHPTTPPTSANNLDRQRDRQVPLKANLTFRKHNLTLETNSGPSFVVPAGETDILKLTKP